MVQASFYRDVVEEGRGRVLDYKSNGPRFDPRPGHGDFFKSP